MSLVLAARMSMTTAPIMVSRDPDQRTLDALDSQR